MSGNSSRSCASTSPIDRCGARTRSCSRTPRAPPTQEGQHEPPDLELVAVLQRRDRRPARGSRRCRSATRRRAPRSRSSVRVDHGVAARHGDVVEEDVGVRDDGRPSWSSRSRRKRLPAFGPRRTTSTPTPSGSSASDARRARRRARAGPRSPRGSAWSPRRPARGVPHDEQKLAPGSFSWPHRRTDHAEPGYSTPGSGRQRTSTSTEGRARSALLLLDEPAVGGRRPAGRRARRDRSSRPRRSSPPPYGSWLICSGASLSASFTATTVPDTGA